MKILNILSRVCAEKLKEKPKGIFSICSANPFVLNAAIRFAKDLNIPLLIESTCNQVNQYGGYMDLNPIMFIANIKIMAAAEGLSDNLLFFGGDHLGPSVWQNESKQKAMEKAGVLVEAYVRAGYQKIHLDASMSCKDDPIPLPQEQIAQRQAKLCQRALAAAKDSGHNPDQLAFVIGTEVPTPGGAHEDQKSIRVSRVDETLHNINVSKTAFEQHHLEKAWGQVKAFVVQPGVEFSDTIIHPYDRAQAKKLTKMIRAFPNLVFEAHSTDYQTRRHLRQLVEDHFAILKVGPALTFAFRETVFDLVEIEKEIFAKNKTQQSHLKEILDRAMLDNPKYWRNHYDPDESIASFQRKFSFLDRSRYYWSAPKVNNALRKLIKNLTTQRMPLTLISQFLPDQYPAVREGRITNTPEALIQNRICSVIADYVYACQIDNSSLTVTPSHTKKG